MRKLLFRGWKWVLRFRIPLCTGIFFLGWLLAGMPVCHGQEPEEGTVYSNPDTGYRVVLEDDAGLLTKEEREELVRGLQAIENMLDYLFDQTKGDQKSC